jgi:UDP-N-acetylmuramoyl-L-alanyl-D-glutamate--2,6-diaminopimelate ligase
LPVDVAIFTNLTQDHLDYHGSMAAYAKAKMMLFSKAGTGIGPRIAVINNDAEYAGNMMLSFQGPEPIMRYAIDDDDELEHRSNYQAKDVYSSAGGTEFNFYTPHKSVAVWSPLTGRVNVYNLQAAMCAALARGLSLEQVVAAVAKIKSVPGRFEVVPGSREAGFTVVVDYAHTDDALKNLIELGRGLVGEHGGRVITMFGCGGDRDKNKRPKMGRVAGAESDLVVVTSDNPRSEDPMEIINEALLGVRETNATFVVEEDRRAAIEVAIRAAKPGDIVLLAGKGHEKEQIFADGPVPFDDVAEAARILREITHEGAR